MELTKCVNALAAAGIGFIASHRAPGGQVTVEVSLNDVTAFIQDSDAFWGAYYKVTARQFRLWQDTQYSVVCAGHTARGNPCKSIIAGGSKLTDPRRWVELQGNYCHVHG